MSTKLHNLSDLSLIRTPSDDAIVHALKQRFDNGVYYTAVGDSLLVALNPGSSNAQQTFLASQEYVADYKDVSCKPERLPVHLFQWVNQAYLHMRRTGVDQSIVFSGESGSGKSHNQSLVLQHLVNLSAHKRSSKLQNQLLKAQSVLEAFGHARTQLNPNASRFGKYTEIQFDKRGRMMGAKILNYLLEKKRVVATPHSEKNFHVFYYLLAGATDQERGDWLLTKDHIQYPYLGQPCGVDDDKHYADLRLAMSTLGFGKRTQGRVMRLLACLLHLGNIQFSDSTSLQEAANIKDTELLDLVADALGVDPSALKSVLTYKTKLIKKDVTTVILDARQAAEQRDDLVTALYSLLFSWIVERINTTLCSDNPAHNLIGLLDMPAPSSKDTFDAFCTNFANERIYNFCLRQLFEATVYECKQDGLTVVDVQYFSNAACIDLLSRPRHGLIELTNKFSAKPLARDTETAMLDAFTKYNSSSASYSLQKSSTGASLFAIRHYTGQVVYHPTGFLDSNEDILNTDFVSLFRGSADMHESYNSFVVGLFANICTESHPKQTDAIVMAQQANKPVRSPSTRHSKTLRRASQAPEEPSKMDEKKHELKTPSTALAQLQSSMNELVDSLDETVPWFVFCLRSNDTLAPNSVDTQRLRAQVRTLGITQMAEQLRVNYTMWLDHDEFCERYAAMLSAVGVEPGRAPRAQCEAMASIFDWTETQAAVGNTKIFLSEATWRQLEDSVRAAEKEEQRRQKEPAADANMDGMSHLSFGSGYDRMAAGAPDPVYGDRRAMLAANAAAAGLPVPTPMNPGFAGSVYSDDQRSYASEEDYCRRPPYETDSQPGSDALGSNMSGYMETKKSAIVELEEVEEDTKMSGVRRRWLAFVWLMTWWIPSKFLLWCGRMKRPDVRMAWREKVTLCMIIFFMSGFIIWFLVFFGRLICPHQDVFSQSELQAHGKKESAYIAIRGEVFDLTKFAPRHWAPEVIPASAVLSYAGTDATDLFPVQVSALCRGVDGQVSDFVSLDFHVNLTDTNAKYHDFRASTGDNRPDWYFEKMVYMRKNYKIGTMGFSDKDVESQATSQVDMGGIKTTRSWAILNNHVYDLTYYIMGGRHVLAPEGQQPPANINMDFMAGPVVELFRQKSGTDITEYWNALPMDPDLRERQEVCLRNLFFVGTRDERNSVRCVFSEYLLLIVTMFLCLVIVFKFLAALQFGTFREPEVYDKFIICQVPCYTEDEESLKKTIDSIATLKYDDKRKLLFIICDGMIVGGGNDRPTPRIVLDVLGVDPNVDPEALTFLSIGEGQKQHNMGKVYSGLYECHGHVVPYIVVVKVGKPTERQKPGNRGKRDSQLVLMRFLNKVHFNAPMTPMELEIYHQIKNVIGVNPGFYEFVLMVDADTEVMPDGLNRMVSSFVHDSKIIGLCGETVLSNEKDTWVTMIQVYEYFISHYMIKAFESLFGSVTCLPGCFSMYRIRSPSKNQPLLISNQVIGDYQINKVDTLHKKNLLHLGEDRYLTTLILKNFPTYKTKFIADAKCATNAPDQWSVLLSQRRRWINSTIHNLGELVFLPQLCGFCCFSMRFVVMLDLVSTLVQPAIVGYLIYLLYTLATSTSTVPLMSIITIAGVYGLQAIIFILHRKWEHIIWMIVSIFAIPVFSFYIPLYAYWHFDDFSWGNTRVVLGDKGEKKLVAADEGTFDPKTIPTMTWDEYEEDLFKSGHADGDDWQQPHPMDDAVSQISGYTFVSRGSNLQRPGMMPSNPSYNVPSIGNPSLVGPPAPSYMSGLSPRQPPYHPYSTPSTPLYPRSGSDH